MLGQGDECRHSCWDRYPGTTKKHHGSVIAPIQQVIRNVRTVSVEAHDPNLRVYAEQVCQLHGDSAMRILKRSRETEHKVS